MIVQRAGMWHVMNEEQTKTLGSYRTEEEAKKRLQQIEYYKAMNERKAAKK